MNHPGKLGFRDDSVSRGFCHFIAFSITLAIAIFATDGAKVVWPPHPKIACILAVLCAMAAGIGHIRFRAQFSTVRPTQSLLLLGFLIAVFGIVSVSLGAIGVYRESGEVSARDEAVSFVGTGDAAIKNNMGVRASDRTRLHSTTLVAAFMRDLFRGSPEALVPLFIGCFLEILPIATLLLTVRRRHRVTIKGSWASGPQSHLSLPNHSAKCPIVNDSELVESAEIEQLH